MNTKDDLRIISKVTPIFSCNTKLEEYIISEDLFCSLTLIENDFEELNSHDTDAFTHNETDFEKCSNFQNCQFNDNYLLCDTVCSCVQSLAYVKLKNIIKVRIDAILFSIIMLELRRSRTFRNNLLSNFYQQYVREEKVYTYKLCDICKRSAVMIHVIVFLSTPKKNVLDSKWNRKIQVLVNEKCELENAMAWLSTLGGAFSALGDSFLKCAEKAGAISVQQLSLALRLGDPLTVCRCKIYFTMSLLQRGYFRRTKRIIRDLYKFSTEGEGSKDFRLKNMCIAVWNRLKYLKSLKAIKDMNAH